jgi:hypothetical protein
MKQSLTSIYIRNAGDMNLHYLTNVTPGCLVIKLFEVEQDSGSHSYQSGFQPYQPQSGVDISMSTNSTITARNINFIEGDVPNVATVPSAKDSTYLQRQTNDVDLNNFFSRPSVIYTYQWGTGLLPYELFNPWTAYFNQPRVINRLANFNMLQAKLHLKFVINGNGFLYGRQMVSYVPFQIQDAFTNLTSLGQDAIQASQFPHIYLDPTMSKGGELILPFIQFFDYLRIPQVAYDTMGDINIRTLNVLKHANGASDSVTVTVFAWAEDVVLSGLTSVDPTSISPQSGYEPHMGEIEQANTSGIVSGPATAIAKAAGALTSIPIIKPYARATEMAAGAVAAAAKAYGYSRPIISKTPDYLVPRPTSSLCNVTVPDLAQKLTYDDKQELTIDPKVMGLDEKTDSLAITAISTRESYLVQFPWAVDTAPETLLFNIKVSPVVWHTASGSPQTSFHLPACCAAAVPFKYWTGTMKYRFQIVCSNYHKGRLRIVHDPQFSVGGDQHNVQYSHIMDLAESHDFTIEVSPAQHTTIMKHHDISNALFSDVWSLTPFTAVQTKQDVPLHNGLLSVYVTNQLTVPNSSINNDISVNVFVSTGDDFEVFVPDSTFRKFTFRPQSGYEEDGQNTDNPSAPQQEEEYHLGTAPSLNPKINHVFVGESIKSFRQALKRYNLHSTISTSLNSTYQQIYYRQSWFPYWRGNIPNAVHETSTNTLYNYCNTVLLHWVSIMFSAMRGSIRYKILQGFQNEGSVAPTTGYITRWSDEEPAYGQEFAYNRSAATPFGSKSEAAFSAIDIGGTSNPALGHDGSIYYNSQINPAVEFEVPFYTPYRFIPGKHISWTALDTFLVGGFTMRMKATRVNSWDIHVATGEDFNLGMFTGMPRIYLNPTNPSPSTVV